MRVELIHYTPLHVIDKAIGKCWDTGPYDDAEKAFKRIERVGLKNKHGSVLEHAVFTFDIDGISRACLQELARHRMASMSVKSTRYTLKELKNADSVDDFFVQINPLVDEASRSQLRILQHLLVEEGMSNDKVKYMLPESYKTSLVWTINLRSLRNFLELRTSSGALAEIRTLAYEVYMQLPDEYQHLVEDVVKC